jgi:murein DD-endopeptidase MepM/ murein hydrolase activator NlpD
MENKVTISIHGKKHGLRQYEINRDNRKFLYIGLFLILLSISMAIFLIIYLNNSLSVSKAQESYVKHEYENMKNYNEALYETMTHIQENLELKEQALSDANMRMHQIEELIGLAPSDDIELKQRISQAELSSQQIASIFKYIPNGSPIEYKGITSKYGYRKHPKTKKRSFHNGTDMKAAMKTPIYATADGVIEYAGYNRNSGYGRLIIISHNFGFRTFFGHLSKIVAKQATYVKKGDLIGYTGNSGLSSGPHLHYEIRYLQHTVNPYWFIKWNVENFREIFTKVKRVPWKTLIKTVSEAS